MDSHAPLFQSVSRDLFIKGMRQVASSVAVVTTLGAHGRHGATVSAFSSVSADPPQLLVCLRSASRIAASSASPPASERTRARSGCAWSRACR